MALGRGVLVTTESGMGRGQKAAGFWAVGMSMDPIIKPKPPRRIAFLDDVEHGVLMREQAPQAPGRMILMHVKNGSQASEETT